MTNTFDICWKNSGPTEAFEEGKGKVAEQKDCDTSINFEAMVRSSRACRDDRRGHEGRQDEEKSKDEKGEG